MTLADFKTAVRFRTEAAGKPVIQTHPTADGALEGHLSESLKMFCAWTYCLRGTVSTNLGSGVSELSFGALSPRMIHPLQVSVNSVILRDYRGVQGPARIEEILVNAIGSGDPTKWAWQTQEIVKFNKAPTSSRTVLLYGFIEHPTVSSGSDAILLPSEWQDAAADYAAVRLLQPIAMKSNMDRVEYLGESMRRDVQRLSQAIQEQFPSLTIPVLRDLARAEAADAG